MGRVKKRSNRKTNKRIYFQLTLFIILLFVCLMILYFLNLLPFGSDILAHERLNILAVGTDSVESKGRADSILVLSVSPKTKDTVLFSIPRDMRVQIPGRGMDKINHAFAYGGIDLLEETVENFMGLSIHYYAVVDFEGFKYIIDALGGININVEKDMYYIDKAGSLKINLHSGQQLLDGQKALDYVRFRFDPLGDLGRIQRQQKLINAMIDKIMNFHSMIKIPDIVSNLTEYISTNMNTTEIVSLAKLIKEVDRKKIWVETISGEPKNIDGVSYLVADSEKIQKRVEYFIQNGLRGLKIEVLNGNQIPGIAHRIARRMKELGFDVVNVDNADNFNYQKSVLIIYSKDIHVDEYLKQFFEDVEVVYMDKPNSKVDMTVIIGKNMIY